MYSSRGQEPRADGEKYGLSGHICGGFEYHFAICASSSLSQISGKLNQSSNKAIKSPSICVDKFVKLSPFLRYIFRYSDFFRNNLGNFYPFAFVFVRRFVLHFRRSDRITRHEESITYTKYLFVMFRPSRSIVDFIIHIYCEYLVAIFFPINGSIAVTSVRNIFKSFV